MAEPIAADPDTDFGVDPTSLSVLLCSDYLPPSGGGVENVVHELAVRLAASGVRVGLLTLGSQGEGRYDTYDNIAVFRARAVDMTGLVGLQSQLSLDVFPSIRRAIRSFKPDVVHLHNRFFLTTLASTLVQAATRSDVPTVTTLHLGSIRGIDGIGGLAARTYEQTAARYVLARSDVVIAVSRAVGEVARELGSPSGRIRIVPNGVDTEQFTPPENERDRDDTILFVGRLVKNKGPDVFLDALSTVFCELPHVDARVVGTGPMESTLRRRAHEHGIDGRVRFEGRVESVASAMRTAMAFCRPSLSEGMPLTLLEAMASALPPVVTPVGGVNEVVDDGVTGLLVPERDVDRLARALSGLVADPDRVSSMGRAARRHVERHYSWEKRFERVVAVYASVVAEQRRREEHTRPRVR